ncbi:MAG: RidA family protein [Novosphingobium sp.]|uniref:RidA family protein n=1 Tax=Novosphingobium sp. TaxID=1874826 RepID=UPI00301A6866
MMKEAFIPAGMEDLCATYHHAPAMRVGTMVWTSGQVGMTDAGELPASVEGQAEFAFQNLARVLNEAGATLDDIVDLQTFHVGLPEGSAAFRAVKDKYLVKNPPAWTALGVSYLAMPGVLLEIKAVAVIGSGAS